MSDSTTKPGRKKIVSWIVVTVAIVGFLLLMGFSLQLQSGSLVGTSAPALTLSLFDGRELSLADLRGQVVVVNFWASWCIPCRDEAPALEQVWREYEGRGVVFVGIDVKDNEARARAFIEEFGLTYSNGPDPYSAISESYRITGVPETFFITRDGQVAGLYVGPISETQLRATLEEVLQR